MRKLFFALLALACSGTCMSATPELVRQITKDKSFLQGTERLFPTDIRRDIGPSALAEGGMWITTPDGERLFARTVRLEPKRAGNQTWIGKVSTTAGERSVVITFGPDAVFGSLLTGDGKPLRLITQGGKTYLSRKDESVAAAQALQLPGTAPAIDYVVPPKVQPTAADVARTHAAMQASVAMANAGAGTGPTIDVLLGYTPGMVTQLGSQSAVVTRLNYLVAVANQAYSDSQVSGRVRLVGTMQVTYPDNGDDQTVLTDLVNVSASGPLASLRARRRALGADLVSLVRPFSSTGQGGACGLGYLNGSGGQVFSTADAPYGFSTIGDGSDGNYYCLDITLAHEMGHNMGLAHDIDDSTGPGAFPYAYGWRQTLATGSFFTIMAYGTGNQQSVPYFANPSINLCDGNPCGNATQANQTLALNQTMPIVAAFNGPGGPVIDLDGDSSADLLLQSPTTGQYASLLVQDGWPESGNAVSVAAGYHIAAVGDLDGNGTTDLVWTSAANDLYFWMNNGSNQFTSVKGPNYPAGWTLIGTADINGDGMADLLWMNNATHQFGYWLMNGAQQVSLRTMNVTPGYYVAAVGDFNGDGSTDLLWTSSAGDLYFWMNNGSGSFASIRGMDYPAGWKLIGAADIDGDGMADLIWTNDSTHQFAYWTMSGATRTGYSIQSISPGYRIVDIDKFTSGLGSIVWTDSSNNLYLWMNNGGGNFNISHMGSFPATNGAFYWAYPTGWSVVSNLISTP